MIRAAVKGRQETGWRLYTAVKNELIEKIPPEERDAFISMLADVLEL